MSEPSTPGRFATLEKSMKDRFADLPYGWEVDFEEEGGQPNGAGTIEPSDYREWFTDDRESHHRQHIVLTGPWEEGPREYVRERQESNSRSRKREIQEHEDRIINEAQAIRARRATTLGEHCE